MGRSELGAFQKLTGFFLLVVCFPDLVRSGPRQRAEPSGQWGDWQTRAGAAWGSRTAPGSQR